MSDHTNGITSNPSVNPTDHNRQFTIDATQVPFTQPAKQAVKKPRAVLATSLALMLGAIGGGVAGAGVGVGAYWLITQPAPVVVNNAESVDWVSGAAAAALPSVVTVSVQIGSSGGNGSGVFLTSDGYVLTNNHVVTMDGTSGTPTIQVKTADGHIMDATVVGTDPNNDLAVIKVTAPLSFTPIKFADSDKVNVGESVVAIGAPLGLEKSVTSGIVSALNRTIQLSSSGKQDGSSGLQWWNGNGPAPLNMKVIQTDAAINPGNSGGALVNAKGELIGINVAIATSGSSSANGSIGVGFSIPSNVAKRISDELRTTGKASHGWFGATVSDNVSKKSEVAAFSSGAKVQELASNGAAIKAGVQVGDIITAFNGVQVDNSADLTALVRYQPSGASITVTVVRGAQTIEIPVVLGDLANLKAN